MSSNQLDSSQVDSPKSLKRFVADSLSLGNLLCGLVAIYMATLGRLDLSLVCIAMGAVFDGLDGAAARKFGSTRWGVYSDDIADAVTYGIAPGVILMIHLSATQNAGAGLNIDAVILGSCYIVFTLGRLVYFALAKNFSEPAWFRGAPSVLGGILVISAASLFADHIVLTAMLTGVACVLMVNFDSRYQHIGRLLGYRKLYLYLALICIAVLSVLGIAGQQKLAIGMVLGISLIYGLAPVGTGFVDLIKLRKQGGRS